jgi:hypothetical protein
MVFLCPFNKMKEILDNHYSICRAGHVERYPLQSYRFKAFFVTL